MHRTTSVRIETVGPEGTFGDAVQVPSGADDMQLILMLNNQESRAFKSPSCAGLTIEQRP